MPDRDYGASSSSLGVCAGFATASGGSGTVSQPSSHSSSAATMRARVCRHHLSVLAAKPRPALNRSARSPLARQLATRCFHKTRASVIGLATVGHHAANAKNGVAAPVTSQPRLRRPIGSRSPMSTNMQSFWSRPRGALILGIAACAACCALPLAALVIGAGAASTLAAITEPIAGILLAAGALLAITLYVRHRRARAVACATDGSCGCGPVATKRTLYSSPEPIGEAPIVRSLTSMIAAPDGLRRRCCT